MFECVNGYKNSCIFNSSILAFEFMIHNSVLLTGASRGIGKAIFEKLDNEGYQVIAPTRKELDLADKDSVKKYIENIKNKQIDILINNAGVNWPGNTGELTDDNIEDTIEINLISPIRLINSVANGMKKRKWGRIVNISSIFGIVARERQILYCATKHGLNGLTNALALELGPYNILVNSICPGFTDTELTKRNSRQKNDSITDSIPLGRFADPSEIAQLVSFVISEKNTYMNGSVIVIDGGFCAR